MPSEYSYFAKKYLFEGDTAYSFFFTDSTVDLTSNKVMTPHDVTHAPVGSILESIGIKVHADLSFNGKYPVPRQTGLLNEILVLGMTLNTVKIFQDKRKSKVRRKFLTPESEVNLSTFLKYERRTPRHLTYKFLKVFNYNKMIASGEISTDKSKEELDDFLTAKLIELYPDLEIHIKTLEQILRLTWILARQLKMKQPNLISDMVKLAESHKEWLLGSDPSPTFRAIESVKDNPRKSDYKILVDRINQLIDTLPLDIIHTAIN